MFSGKELYWIEQLYIFFKLKRNNILLALLSLTNKPAKSAPQNSKSMQLIFIGHNLINDDAVWKKGKLVHLLTLFYGLSSCNFETIGSVDTNLLWRVILTW